MIFQLSKITESLVGYVRSELKLAPFIVISCGNNQQANGYVKFMHNLTDLIHVEAFIDKQKSHLVLLEEADGSEEVPHYVKGVLVKHELPQLSHIAIRAR